MSYSRGELKGRVNSAHKHIPISACINPKGYKFCGFGGQCAFSRAGADPEILVSGWDGGQSLIDALVVIYLLFTEFSN